LVFEGKMKQVLSHFVPAVKETHWPF